MTTICFLLWDLNAWRRLNQAKRKVRFLILTSQRHKLWRAHNYMRGAQATVGASHHRHKRRIREYSVTLANRCTLRTTFGDRSQKRRRSRSRYTCYPVSLTAHVCVHLSTSHCAVPGISQSCKFYKILSRRQKHTSCGLYPRAHIETSQKDERARVPPRLLTVLLPCFGCACFYLSSRRLFGDQSPPKTQQKKIPLSSTISLSADVCTYSQTYLQVHK